MNKTSPVNFIFMTKHEWNCRSNHENLSQQLKDYLREWCEDTTSHGFLNLVKTKNWISRIIWIILIVWGITYSLLSNLKNNFHFFSRFGIE